MTDCATWVAPAQLTRRAALELRAAHGDHPMRECRARRAAIEALRDRYGVFLMADPRDWPDLVAHGLPVVTRVAGLREARRRYERGL